jgi:hexosaminidase
MIVALLASFSVCAQTPGIIPAPARFEPSEGTFHLTRGTRILYPAGSGILTGAIQQGSALLNKNTGFTLSSEIANVASPGSVFVQLNLPSNAELGAEGYVLRITPDIVFLSANASAGVLYGFQTLAQLLSGPGGTKLAAGVITDYPRFGYRGLHLDVSRHFMPAEFIYELIDYMAMHKLNVFHWHLVDDQGWRLEIKKYPKLTEVGAWRVDRSDLHWNSRGLPRPGEKATYGGFYSQDEVKKIVKYASERNITIIPEIEMPAHVMSALAAYPEFSCTGENLGVPAGGVWPITHIYCAGKEETFHFLEDVLTETMALFPSSYIHVGGDEADKAEWKKCALCQKRIQDEGLKDEHGLQSYFIQRMEKFLNRNGRKLIGWDEILEGGLAPEATVMSWRGESGGIEAAKMGHDVVMTPGSHCYFDHYQGDPALEPMAFGGFTTLRKVYSYEPVPAELTPGEAKHVLGAQANVWTEYMTTPEHVEYMVFPRLAALSEVLWSPASKRDWADFSGRMETQYKRYEKAGINYAKSAYQVTAQPNLVPEEKKLEIKLSSEVHNPVIRYTTDGTTPSVSSARYTQPFSIDKTSTVKAAVFIDGQSVTSPLSRAFHLHKAVACPVDMQYPNSKSYDGSGIYTLVDGVKGSNNHGDGFWKGFNKNDMVATIDLGGQTDISYLEADAVQNAGAWIFLPREVAFEVSEDGQSFRSLGKVSHKIPVTSAEKITHNFTLKKKAQKVRFVRVTARNLGMCPEGHAGEGQPAWLFVSEIIVR